MALRLPGQTHILTLPRRRNRRRNPLTLEHHHRHHPQDQIQRQNNSHPIQPRSIRPIQTMVQHRQRNNGTRQHILHRHHHQNGTILRPIRPHPRSPQIHLRTIRPLGHISPIDERRIQTHILLHSRSPESPQEVPLRPSRYPHGKAAQHLHGSALRIHHQGRPCRRPPALNVRTHIQRLDQDSHLQETRLRNLRKTL